MAAPMVWRTGDGRFAFGYTKIAELRLQFGDFRADALDRCVHDPFAYRESCSLLLRLSYSELP
jgi:hypothetical protein